MKRRREKIKAILFFLFFQIIFIGITAPFILFYGPFTNAKSIFVGTAMSSMNYQWLATTFLSNDEIDEIIGNKKQMVEEVVDEEEIEEIQIQSKEKNELQYLMLDKNDNFIGHVLLIKDPKRVKVGYSSKLDDTVPMGEETSVIAENNNAIAAINGGAFKDGEGEGQWTSNGGIPVGIIISQGNLVYDDTNGNKDKIIGISEEGKLIAGSFTLNELIDMNITEVVSFDTKVLVSGGELTPISGDGGEGKAPRTLIGQRIDGTIVLVVLDAKDKGGRVAATIKEAQEVMYKLECYTATTLDGGKSSTMYYRDEVVNSPSYAYGERNIASAIVVK